MIEDWKDAAFYLGAALVSVLQLIGISQIRRIGRLEKDKADKTDLEKALDRVLAELRAEREASDSSREALHEKVNKVAVAVGRLEGRAYKADNPQA